MTLSDIHFNPFNSCQQSPCALITALKQASVSEWSAILTKYQTKPNSYGSDTNYPLLTRALTAASKTAQEKNVTFVAVLGDYLAHNYKQNYIQYSGDETAAGYQSFVKKTNAFLTGEFSQAFPSKNIFMLLGNNDSYIDDYVSEPNGIFYHDIASLWSNLIKDKTARTALQQKFPLAGYYAVNVPDETNLRLIILNSVLFSTKAQGTNVDQAANQELNWLQDELACVNNQHQKALILLHIPPGVDVYASLKQDPYQIIELWKPQYSTRFEALLKRNEKNISGILSGHFHMDFFQVIHSTIPVSGTPAISPMFGNNPAFKVFNYSRQQLNLSDYTSYFYPLNGSLAWSEEYDFNQIYQPNCQDCTLIKGMSLLAPTGSLATNYIHYFAVSTDSQPISKNKWRPYYWCDIHTLQASHYQACLSGAK